MDSSALVKLLVTEEGSDLADEIWDGAHRLAASRLTYVETRAALAAARRTQRPSSRAAKLREELEARWRGLDVLELDDAVALLAGDVSDAFGLRAGDAIHLASALTLQDPELTLASWDARLRHAAAEAGLGLAPAL